MNKFKEIYLKNKSKLIITVSVILILIALINIYLLLAVRITSNDECLWNEKEVSRDSVVIIFSNVKVGGVSWNAGIRDGDRLLAIDNTYVTNPTSAQIILNKFSYGQYADYTIKKKDSGAIVHTKVFVKKLIQIGSLANGILALIWMLIGFIVLMAKTTGRVQKLFYSIGVCAVLATLGNFVPITNDPELIRKEYIGFLIVLLGTSIGNGFIPFLFLNFFWTFPKQRKFLNKKFVRRLLIILPIALSIYIFVNTISSYGAVNIDLNKILFERTLLEYLGGQAI